MAQVDAEPGPVHHRIELTNSEYVALEEGTGLVVTLPDASGDWHIDPRVVITPSTARRTVEMHGILGWFSPRLSRGSSSTLDIENGDSVTIVMPDEGLGELFA